jgi:hypothetical protein
MSEGLELLWTQHFVSVHFRLSENEVKGFDSASGYPASMMPKTPTETPRNMQ